MRNFKSPIETVTIRIVRLAVKKKCITVGYSFVYPSVKQTNEIFFKSERFAPAEQ